MQANPVPAPRHVSRPCADLLRRRARLDCEGFLQGQILSRGGDGRLGKGKDVLVFVVAGRLVVMDHCGRRLSAVRGRRHFCCGEEQAVASRDPLPARFQFVMNERGLDLGRLADVEHPVARERSEDIHAENARLGRHAGCRHPPIAVESEIVLHFRLVCGAQQLIPTTSGRKLSRLSRLSRLSGL